MQRPANRTTLTADEATARGTDGFGHPLGPDSTFPNGTGEIFPPGTRGTMSSGKGGKHSNLLDLIKTLEDGDLGDQVEMHAYVEDARALFMRIAVIIALASGGMKEDAKRKARESADGRMTLGDKIKLAAALRKISRKFGAAADHAADAAADMAASWRIMESCLDDLEQGAAKPQAKRGFNITRGR